MNNYCNKHYICKLIYKGIDLHTNLFRYQIIWQHEKNVIIHSKFVNIIKSKRMFEYYNKVKKLRNYLKLFTIFYMSKDIILSEKTFTKKLNQ